MTEGWTAQDVDCSDVTGVTGTVCVPVHGGYKDWFSHDFEYSEDLDSDMTGYPYEKSSSSKDGTYMEVGK